MSVRPRRRSQPRSMHFGSKLSSVRRLVARLGGYEELRRIALYAELEDGWLHHMEAPALYTHPAATSLVSHMAQFTGTQGGGRLMVRQHSDMLAVIEMARYVEKEVT